MYGALIVFSVPMPLVAGWLSDRIGRKPVIIGCYVGGAIGFAIFLLAGSGLAGLWFGIFVMGLFSFAESPQLQALLADIAAAVDPRHVVRAVLHAGVRGRVAVGRGLRADHRRRSGRPSGCRSCSWLMAASFILAGLSVLPIRAGGRRQVRSRGGRGVTLSRAAGSRPAGRRRGGVTLSRVFLGSRHPAQAVRCRRLRHDAR